MAYQAGSAYVQVLPSLKGFNTSVQTQLRDELGGVGEQIGSRLGGDLSKAFTPALSGLRNDLEQTATKGVTSMSTLARGTAPVLDKLAQVSPVLGRVRDGFTSSVAASSAFSGAAGTLGGRLRSVVDTTAEIGTGFGKMGAQAEGVLKRVGSTIGSSLTSPLRSAKDLLGQYGLTAGSALAVAGVGAVTMGIKFDAAQESAVMAFTTMLHSGQQARDFMAQLTQFASQTPFDLPGVTSAAQKLMAFGFQARDVLPTLTAIGDAVSGMGGSAEEIDRVTLAIGQMSAKGKVQSDEILQLTEAGIPALRILANQYGVTTAKMQDMVTKGLVPSGEAIPKLLQGIEQGTKGAAGDTTAFAGMMSQQATTLTGVWSNFTDNFNKAMGNLIAPAMPAIKSGLSWLTTQLGSLPGWFERVRALAAPIFAQLAPVIRNVGDFVMTSAVPALRNLWTAVQPVVVLVGGAFLAALRTAGSLLSTVVGPALVAVSSWLRPLMPVIVGIAAAFAGWFAIGLAVSAVVRGFALLKTVLGGVTLAWRILSLAFSISPIGLIITLVAALVAGVIYAWTHFAGFREVVLNVWHAIQAAASFAWNSILKPAFDGIVSAVQAVGRFFVWLWGVVSPVLSAIGNVAKIVAAIIITVVVTPIVLAIRLWAFVLTWLWTNVVSPVLGFIGALFTWLWTNAIKPVIDFVVGYFRMWASIAVWLWQNVIQPAASGIAAAFTWLWNNGIKPAIDFVVGYFRFLASIGLWLWNNVFIPVAQGIGNVFTWLYTNVISPVGSAIGVALNAVGSAFRWVYDNVIRPVWTAVGTVARTVYDNVIHPAFEAVKSAVHAVGQAFSDAVDWIGRVWGGIKAIAAKPVNFIIDTVYNHGIAAVWNWVADLLGIGKLKPASTITFAGGGVLGGYAPGQDRIHAMLSPGEAVLVPELVAAIGPQNIIAANAAASGGRPATIVGSGFSGGGIARFAGGGVVSDLLDFVSGVGGDVVAMFKDPVGWISSHIGAGASQWVSMLAKMPATLIDKAVTWLWDKVKDWLNPFSSGGGGSADLAGWIAAAIGFTGVGPDWAGPLRTLIMRESGGNPRAQNNWDINAQRGDPSRGLMQTIGATFAAYHDPRLPNDIFNPVANIVAGINYIRSRYGTIFNVQQAVGSTPKGYDSGGWLPPGYSTVYNGTGRPEAVFTAQQFDAITAAAGSDGGTFVGTLTLDSGEFLGVVNGEITRAQSAMGTAIAQRTRV
ncbi:tape measure protein [Amycolatopsis sp. NPDC003865]